MMPTKTGKPPVKEPVKEPLYITTEEFRQDLVILRGRLGKGFKNFFTSSFFIAMVLTTVVILGGQWWYKNKHNDTQTVFDAVSVVQQANKKAATDLKKQEASNQGTQAVIIEHSDQTQALQQEVDELKDQMQTLLDIIKSQASKDIEEVNKSVIDPVQKKKQIKIVKKTTRDKVAVVQIDYLWGSYCKAKPHTQACA